MKMRILIDKRKLYFLFILFGFKLYSQENTLKNFNSCNDLYQPILLDEITDEVEAGEWIMVFEDNFDGGSLDATKWYDCDKGWNRVHDSINELQYYKSENCIIDNGKLKLTAKYEPGNYVNTYFDENNLPYNLSRPFDYTSGWVEPKINFEYGFFEISAKVPKGKSFWSAFWLYECSSEIDIFETNGTETNKIKTNVIDWICGSDPYVKAGQCQMDDISLFTDYSDTLHKYSLEWNQYKLVFRIDGNIYRSSYRYYPSSGDFNIENNNNLSYIQYWRDKVFPDTPLRLILNFAIGGPTAGYGNGPPDSTTVFPSSFDIEYLRIWKLNNDGKDINICNLDFTNDPSIITGKKITVGGLNCISNVLDEEHLELIATEEILIKPEFNSFIGSDFTAKIHTGQKNNLIPYENIHELAVVNKSEIEFEISPNPIKDYLNVNFNGDAELIEVMDLNGRIIQIHKKPNSSLLIDFSKESQGIYFVNLKTPNETITKKIIKL